MKVKWDSALLVTLVACAVTTTGLVVYREFFASTTSPAQLRDRDPVFIKDWKAHRALGILRGSSLAPVQLIEFADFECPFCATFHERIKTLRMRYPKQIAVSYVHFPLPMHRFAVPAARVAECADQQDRFEAIQDQLFEQQEAFGLKPWSEFATAAAVPDLAAFESCMQSKDPIPRVVAGQKLGGALNIQGTPTLMINGWMLGSTPGVEELDQMVKAILAGKSPVSQRRRAPSSVTGEVNESLAER